MASQGKRLAKEIMAMVESPIEGISVTINDNLDDIEAIISGPQNTPFEGGRFKIRMLFGSDFPTAPPKCTFLTKVFHPNVSVTGEICVNTLKKDWKAHMGIKDVLLTIKCLLIAPNAESALNEEAGKLILEDYDAYFKHAKLLTSIHATPLQENQESVKRPLGPSIGLKATSKKTLRRL